MARPRLRQYALRAMLVAASLMLWFWSQSLIGHREPSGSAIGDAVHDLTAPLNGYLGSHPAAADGLLIASSLVIDLLGLFLLGSTIFHRTIRPFIGLLLVFGLRQVCQESCSLPPPEHMIWRNPGMPSLLVTYGVANDLFFSGHTAIAVVGAIELYRRYQKRWLIPLCLGIVAFEASAVLVLRAHYTMDVFTGAIAAILATGAAARLAPCVDRVLSPPDPI